MAQVINDSTPGGRLGNALGTGLNQAAQHKLNFLTNQYEQENAFSNRENNKHI